VTRWIALISIAAGAGSAQPLRVEAVSLPPAFIGLPYSATLRASGGTPPYRWQVSREFIPAPLRLDATTGVLSGSPASPEGDFSFGLRVNDSAGAAAERDFTLQVRFPPGLFGLSQEVEPATQPSLWLALARPVGVEVIGQLELRFESRAANAADDPNIRFSSGSRTVLLTIPPNTDRSPEAAFQAGSVTGRISVVLTSLQAGGQNYTVTSLNPASVQVASRPPRSLTGSIQNRTAGGFTVVIDGVSSPRQITEARFRLTGSNLQQSEFSPPVQAVADAWFSSAASTQFGGSFRYTQPVTVTGDSTGTAIRSLEVTLSNRDGASQPLTINLP
jgi:hypothetical protein